MIINLDTPKIRYFVDDQVVKEEIVTFPYEFTIRDVDFVEVDLTDIKLNISSGNIGLLRTLKRDYILEKLIKDIKQLTDTIFNPILLIFVPNVTVDEESITMKVEDVTICNIPFVEKIRDIYSFVVSFYQQPNLVNRIITLASADVRKIQWRFNYQGREIFRAIKGFYTFRPKVSKKVKYTAFILDVGFSKLEKSISNWLKNDVLSTLLALI